MNSISNEGLLETVSKIIKKIYDTVVKMLSGVKKFILGTLKKLTNKISRLTSDDHKLVLDELNKINIDEVSLENKKVTRYTDEDKSIATSIISYFAKKIINGNTDERRVLANIIIANRLNEENPNEITKFTDIITGIYADIKSGKELNKVVDVDLISAIKFRFEYKQAIKEVGYVNGESSDQPGIDSVVVNTLNLHKYGKTGPAGIALSEVITGGSGTNMTVKYCFERIVEMFKKSASNNFRGILNISSVLEKSIDRLEKISKNDLSNLEKDYQKQNLDISVIRTYGQALNDITRMFKALVRAISLYQYSYLEYYKSVKQTNQSIDGIDQKFQQEMIGHSQESYIKGSYLSYYKNINSVYDYVPPPLNYPNVSTEGLTSKIKEFINNIINYIKSFVSRFHQRIRNFILQLQYKYNKIKLDDKTYKEVSDVASGKSKEFTMPDDKHIKEAYDDINRIYEKVNNFINDANREKITVLDSKKFLKFLRNGSGLPEIKDAVDEIVKEIEGNKYVHLNLEMHLIELENNKTTPKKFLNTLSTKVKTIKAIAGVIDEISSFVDNLKPFAAIRECIIPNKYLSESVSKIENISKSIYREINTDNITKNDITNLFSGDNNIRVGDYILNIVTGEEYNSVDRARALREIKTNFSDIGRFYVNSLGKLGVILKSMDTIFNIVNTYNIKSYNNVLGYIKEDNNDIFMTNIKFIKKITDNILKFVNILRIPIKIFSIINKHFSRIKA